MRIDTEASFYNKNNLFKDSIYKLWTIIAIITNPEKNL